MRASSTRGEDLHTDRGSSFGTRRSRSVDDAEKDHTSLGFQGRCIAILVGILIVANPELRVLLILVDALGLELVILILAIQLRGWLPAIRVVLKSACSRCCEGSFFIVRGVLPLFGAVLPGQGPVVPVITAVRGQRDATLIRRR
jgi:hypothetical protein